MLKTRRVDLSITDLIFDDEANTINEVSGNYKVVEAKVRIKTAKFKSNNSVKSFLAKFQLFAKSSESDFLTSKTRLAITKLNKLPL